MSQELQSILACLSVINVLYIITLAHSIEKEQIMQDLCLEGFSFPLT